MKTVNILEAKTNFSKLVDQATKGETVIIGKAGTPVAQLTAYVAEQSTRTPGGWEGQVWIAADFDAPDARIEQMFQGSEESALSARVAEEP